MDIALSHWALGIAAVAFILVAAVLLGQHRALARLRCEHRELVARLSDQQSDLAGLCAAGVNIDRLLLDHRQRLREFEERLESLQTTDAGASPYHGAIERIRKGASPQELVSEFGFSLSEAELLVRLHRG